MTRTEHGVDNCLHQALSREIVFDKTALARNSSVAKAAELAWTNTKRGSGDHRMLPSVQQ